MSNTTPAPAHLLTPRDWQMQAIKEATALVGTSAYDAKAAESKRYGMLAEALEAAQAEVARLREKESSLDRMLALFKEVQAVADERDEALARLAEIDKQEPKRPGWYQNPTDERWFECPDDAEILDSVFYDESPKVGDEFELDVCWNGKQKFRVTKIEDAESDDVEVEFVSGNLLFAASGAPHVQPIQARELSKYPVALSRDDTEHGVYYYKASEVDAMLATGVLGFQTRRAIKAEDELRAIKGLLMPATAAPLSDGKVAPVDMSRLPKGAV